MSHFSEEALNKGLDDFDKWRESATKNSSDNQSEHVLDYLTHQFKDKINEVLNRESNKDPKNNEALVFLAAAGREMSDLQIESFMSIFNKLPTFKKGELIAIYKAVVRKDPNQRKLAQLIPVLEKLLNREIDRARRTKN